jgi:hypothetical protein
VNDSEIIVTVTVTAVPAEPWAQIRYQYLDGTIGTAPMINGRATMPPSCRLLAIEQVRSVFTETTARFLGT